MSSLPTDVLGQKRERTNDDASQKAPLPFMTMSGRNNRRAGGMLSMLGAAAISKPTAAAASLADPSSTAAPAGAANDLLSQLGLGTNFVQEQADKAHLAKLEVALSLNCHNNSLITSLFSAGAPQYDPLNEPFMAIKSAERPILVEEKVLLERLGRLHHPLSTLEGSLLESEVPPPPIKLHKTPEEFAKERKARGAAKREARIAQIKEGRIQEEQKLRLRNLETTLKDRFEKDYLGTLTEVTEQIKKREEAHNEANYQRYLEAVPRQMVKREEKLLVKAERGVILNIYRCFPIREKSTLFMFVKFANDKRLRGFFAWIDGRDALVVLMGGEAPMRDMDNWLSGGRMQWRSSADTVCNKTFSTRVVDMERFSFHEKGVGAAGGEEEGGNGGAEAAGEAAAGDTSYHASLERVYLKEFKSIALAEDFFFNVMPTKGPWPSLAFLWRGAMAEIPSNE